MSKLISKKYHSLGRGIDLTYSQTDEQKNNEKITAKVQAEFTIEEKKTTQFFCELRILLQKFKK